jgi:hypothetical protein
MMGMTGVGGTGGAISMAASAFMSSGGPGGLGFGGSVRLTTTNEGAESWGGWDAV